MPRIARVVIPGCVHHITQRGNNRQDVFFVDQDRGVYLEILRGQAAIFGLTLQGYCLMTNHIHLIATPAKEESLAKALGRTHFLYTQYVNRLHGRSGHLWQNRFYSCALDDEHFWSAMAYVERNPVRARIVRMAWRYPHSSAAAHCGQGADASGMLNLAEWRKMLAGNDWSDSLGAAQEASTLAGLRLGTMTGRPLGGDRFIAKLETMVGRRLRALPRGRPSKNPNK